MTESKVGKWTRQFEDGNGGNARRRDQEPGFGQRQTSDRLPSEPRPGSGFEAYRRWLTRVQAPGTQRIPLDPSLYTWKGYRNWTDRVRRDWKPGDQER